MPLALAATLPLAGMLDGPAALAQAIQPIPVQTLPGEGALELKVRRLPDAVEVVIEGTGPGPQLQQFTNSAGWEGQLILPRPSGLRRGPQQLALPEAGFKTISLEGVGDRFVIQVTPVANGPVNRPVVSADGRNLILSFPAVPQSSFQTGQLDLNTPGRVPQAAFVPPLQPRAAAPPLGDMAVGSMVLRNPSYVNVRGPSVTMTLRNAPARDALMAVAQLGGYGFVYVDDTLTNTPSPGALSPPSGAQRLISIAFRNEGYARAVNSILLAAGLQGKLEGNLIIAGPKVLSKTFGTQLSKVYRLNQVSANSAADYLASLGATINKTYTTTSTSSEVSSTGTPANNTANSTATTATTTEINSFGAGQGPLLGLIGTTDSRLGTITLVGDSSIVLIAENYLKQLDLRQRQVALSVRLLDVNLENSQDIANSFAFRWGNNFIVNDNGQLLGAFGSQLPPTANDFRRGVPSDLNVNLTPPSGTTGGTITTEGTNLPGLVASGAAAVNGGTTLGNSLVDGFRRNPGLNYPKDAFFDFVQAQIISRNTKLLASPTLILQENPSRLRASGGGASASGRTGGLDEYTIDSPIGRSQANEAAVRVGTNVITNVTVTTDSVSGSTQCELELSTAGLTLGARVEKIDDNGFVTFSLSPSVSAVTDTVPGPPSCTSEISILSVRRLDTGALRVREGQTLILTGVISDFDVAEVSKWPILGDLPLVGQFFRASSNQRQKRELVIMVTPRIIRDDDGGTFGYGFQPSSREMRQFVSNPR
ncbi:MULTISPECIES: type II secretion system protein GspD [unclassified Synechococcus]|uniref:type II secretion system protein GspD n=1 Tax=unclassified Synechococcus TaxID=2626047 RepID=UPI0021A4A911|nr:MULTISPECIES: general secretion pathway protein D [unclassified Synechococcus]